MSKKCLSCEVTSGRQKLPDGPIFETELFHAHQDVAYPVPGQIILAAKRHFQLLTDMNSKEASEFIPLVQQLRKVQAEQADIEHVYYFYNEDTKHHFHLWMVPRYEWMSDFGKSIEAVRPALIHARDVMNSNENTQKVSQTVRRFQRAMEDY